MILVCPSCSTRYLLSSAAIGAEGREVRCAKCHHEWYQEVGTEEDIAGSEDAGSDENTVNQAEETPESPDSVPNLRADELDGAEEGTESAGAEEPIPDSVKPLPEGSNVPAFAKDVLRARPSLQARITGYATALLLFICLLVSVFIFKPQIVSSWPPSAMIYELAGFPVHFKGENLVMESLSATVLKNSEGQDILVLKGRVINLTNKSVDVPQMRAVLRSTNGEDGEGWIIDAPVDQVKSGASFAFTSDYPNVPHGIGSVNLTFVPTVIGAKEIKKTEITE